jgi:hypothetical protein
MQHKEHKIYLAFIKVAVRNKLPDSHIVSLLAKTLGMTS